MFFKKQKNHILSWTMLLLLFIVSGVNPLTAQKKLNPNFDMSSIKAFWPVMDILVQDNTPTTEEWNSLFDTRGNNTLRREFKDQFFIRYFEAAYMPSKAALKQEILDKAAGAGSRYAKWFPVAELEALEWTRDNRKILTAKMNSFEEYPYTRLATVAALQFLPETEAEDLPEVAFVIFNDSRGWDPVIMSLNNLAREEAELNPEMLKKLDKRGYNRHTPHVFYFGHEFFHHLRAKKEEFIYPEENNEDYTLISLLDQIENEGIADLINVKPLYWGVDAPLAGSQKAVKEQNDRQNALAEVKAFADLLTGIADHPEWKYGLSKQAQRTITRSGHVAGFYMANLILDHFSKEDLIAVVRNPFRFFLLYQKAAQHDRHAPRLTEKAAGLIRDLENKYALTE